MKQIFFKTVRSDYSSVWAIGKYRKIYEIGKRYTFDPRTPAHIFGVRPCSLGRTDYKLRVYEPDCQWEEQEINHDHIYNHRAEPDGSRVIICYGEVRKDRVPVCFIDNHWNFEQAPFQWRFVSDDFTVIGEIKPTAPRLKDGPIHAGLKVKVDIKKVSTNRDSAGRFTKTQQ